MSALAPWSLPPMALDRPWMLAVAVVAAAGWLVGWRTMEQHRRARLRRFAEPVAWERLGVAASAGRGTAWRVAAVLLTPIMPTKCAEVLTAYGSSVDASGGMLDAAHWGRLKAGTKIAKCAPFMRVDAPVPGT